MFVFAVQEQIYHEFDIVNDFQKSSDCNKSSDILKHRKGNDDTQQNKKNQPTKCNYCVCFQVFADYIGMKFQISMIHVRQSTVTLLIFFLLPFVCLVALSIGFSELTLIFSRCNCNLQANEERKSHSMDSTPSSQALFSHITQSQ